MNYQETRKRLMAKWMKVGVVLTALWIWGCASTPELDMSDPYAFDDQRPAAQVLQSWFEGERPEVGPVGELTEAEDLFVAGELHYWEGDLEGAFEYYMAMLGEHPGHPLNRYAAHRVFRMRYDIIDFASRVSEELAHIRFDDEGALTRWELAYLTHDVAQELWRRSEADYPFEFAHAGRIATWRATPRLSPWRLLDFDEPFAPESEERLGEIYRSPMVAVDSEASRKPVQLAHSGRLGRSLSLGSSGVYYLESTLIVEGAGPREVLVAGRFPGAARVWINGVEVLERREEAYEAGRKIRPVQLAPGEHRVLVKLAYQAGSRDWFDLFFVPTSGPVFGDAGLGSSPGFEGVARDGASTVRLLADAREAHQIEPMQVADKGTDRASSAALYGAMLSAYASGDVTAFEGSWSEMMERHPRFVAGHQLGSYHMRTRWDVPSQLRDALALSRLRNAQELAPKNLHVLMQLENRLRDQGREQEYSRILERARDIALGRSTESPELAALGGESGGRADDPGLNGKTSVKQLRPLVSWARHLDRKGWSHEAEQAWQEVLSINPRHCMAAREVHNLYRNRQYFPPLDEISPGWANCPSLVSRWVRDHPDRVDERLEFARRQAQRYPYNATRHNRYAQALIAGGDLEEAAAVYEAALERLPHNSSLWRGAYELARLQGDDERARQLLVAASGAMGRTSVFEWKLAQLDDAFPLNQLLRDGRQAALEEVQRTDRGDELMGEADNSGSLDDAYYVIDFAAREYFEDGASWTLTQQMVRVMTRGAIDRFAEITVPSGAYLLVARTIKEDGTVLMPEGISGDSTLSMPGLAQGDMVELAYLQFSAPRPVPTQVSGNRFFFQMPTISSRLSEYVVVGTEDLSFESSPGAPDAEIFEFNGKQAHRFTLRNSRHPRSEPLRVSGQEYLPWVREVRSGVETKSLEMERRYRQEALRDSARPSPVVDEIARQWAGHHLVAGEVTDADVLALYYGAAGHHRRILAQAFNQEAAHAIQERSGSPVVVLHTLFNQLGIEHDVYLARSDENPEKEQKVGEIGRYTRAVMRIKMPESGEDHWIQIHRQDAMFGAIEPEVDGQPAICVTCPRLRRETVSSSEQRGPKRHIDLVAELDEQGELRGALRYRFEGIRAVRVRAALRARTDDDDRRDYIERVLTDQISGADLVGYEVRGEDRPDEPLYFEVEFVRPGFARATQDRLVIDGALFQEAMQRIYTRPSERTTPLFVGYERHQTYAMELTLPPGWTVDLRASDVSEERGAATQGSFTRRTWVDGDLLRLESSIRLPRQRINAEDYGAFREWTRLVEESADLWVSLGR